MTSSRNLPVKIPFWWWIIAWICIGLLGFVIFIAILRHYGVSFPMVAGQSTDPFFFATLAAVIIPVLLLCYIEKVFRSMAQKRSIGQIVKDIAKEMAVDSAKVAAGAVLDALIGGDQEMDDSTSSSHETRKKR
jgi:hypothetical protein